MAVAIAIGPILFPMKSMAELPLTKTGQAVDPVSTFVCYFLPYITAADFRARKKHQDHLV